LGGESSLTAGMLLSPDSDEEERSALTEAKEFLLDELSGGGRKQSELLKEAKSLGISERTLKRAKSEIGIKAAKEGFGEQGYWIWPLPDTAKDAKHTDSRDLAPLNDKRVENPNPLEDGKEVFDQSIVKT